MDNVFFSDELPIDNDNIDISGLQKAEIIPDNCVMVRLEISAAGLEKQFASGEVIQDDGIDNTLVKTSKNLVDKKYLDPIKKCDGRMRETMYRIGMRPKFLGNGNVIVPIRLLSHMVQSIEQYREEREALVNSLISQYEAAKQETHDRNPALYREEEYPTVEQLRDKFQVSYNIFSVAFPDILERIEEGAVDDMNNRLAAEMRVQREAQTKQLEDAVDEIKQGLRAGFYELVSNLEDKVRGVGTERKVFKPGFVSAMRTFLETFDAKNIGNDSELSDMVSKCKQVLAGVSPDSIRNNYEVRLKLETELGSIKKNLSELMEPASRSATFA